MKFFEPLLAAAALLACLAAATPGNAAEDPPASPHPVVAKLIARGLDLGDGKSVTLPPPLVTATMSAAEQRAAVTKLVGASQLKRFCADSIAAQHKTRVATGRVIAGVGTVRRMDQHFVAHGDLTLIRDEELMTGFMDEEKKRDAAKKKKKPEPFATYFTRIEPPEGVKTPYTDGLNQPYVYKLRYPLLDKVVMSGLMRGQSYSGEGVLIESALSAADLLADPREPTVWRPIPKQAKGDADLGPAQPFRGFAGYMQLTELKFLPGAVLIETHGVLIEPEGWFGGRNLLASKLPILGQQNVRDFRRQLGRLKQAAARRDAQ